MKARFTSAVAVLGLLTFAGFANAQGGECDRECLKRFVDGYLDALVASDPGRLRLSPEVRFTEDTVEMNLGEGLWENTTGVTSYRQDILDEAEGIAATQVVVEEGGAPVLLMLRMQIAGGRITEVESVVTRDQSEGILLNIEALVEPAREMALVPRDDQRMSRQAAVRTAEYYPAGLIVGSFVEVDAPFSADAYRFENGGRMAGPGCSREGCEDIKAQTIMGHPDLTSEVKAVDEAMGIVLLRMNFGDTGSYGDGNALIVWEAFKVYDDQIHAVEAFMEIMPADAGSGWD
jgi:hypothetical protein